MESLEEKLINKWINHNRNDDCDYNGNYSYISDSVYCDGYGYNYGYGYGCISSSGNENGSGYAYSQGFDYSSGYGNGSGAGFGHDSGFGSCYKYSQRTGSRYIKKISGRKLYIIDQIGTIIEHVRGQFASGYILNADLTLTPCYIAKGGGMFAHGKTIYEAHTALEDKIMKTMPLKQRIEKFKTEFPDYNKKVDANRLFEWHHILTGSCLMGREQFCKERNINYKNGKYSVNEFLSICKDEYGWKKNLKCLQNTEIGDAQVCAIYT